MYCELIFRFGYSSVENVMLSRADRTVIHFDEPDGTAVLKLVHSVKFINDKHRVAHFLLFSSTVKGTTSLSWSGILTVVDNCGVSHVHLCSDLVNWNLTSHKN